MVFTFNGAIWNYKKSSGRNAGFEIKKVDKGFLHISFWKWCCNIHYEPKNKNGG